MQIVAKLLNISIIIFGLIQNCYTAQQIGNIVQQPLYNYNSVTNTMRPTIEQYCTYKNVLPITFNNYETIKSVIHFLREKQPQDNELLLEFLRKIYNFANYLSSGNCVYWGPLDWVIDSYWETEWSLGQHENRDYNTVAPTEPTDNTTNNLLKKVNIDIQSINEIVSRIQLLQNQLNPERYQNKNPLSGYRNITITELFYYVSNLWVQTTQDIIYSINKAIKESNGSRLKIKSKIIQPCYDVFTFTLISLKHLLEWNVFLLNNLQNDKFTKKELRKIQNKLKHQLDQNNLNMKLINFQQNYLDAYPINATYYNSSLTKNIFEREKKIIAMLEEHKAKFKKKTQEIEENNKEQFNKNIQNNNIQYNIQETAKVKNPNKKPFEYYLFDTIQKDLNENHFKYKKTLIHNISKLKHAVDKLNNNFNNAILSNNQLSKNLNSTQNTNISNNKAINNLNNINNIQNTSVNSNDKLNNNNLSSIQNNSINGNNIINNLNNINSINIRNTSVNNNKVIDKLNKNNLNSMPNNSISNNNIINNLNKEEISKIYNEKFINESNEYLQNMFKTINNNIEKFRKYYDKVEGTEKVQYRQWQLKAYEKELNLLQNAIEKEKNIKDYALPHINYIDNMVELFKEYED